MNQKWGKPELIVLVRSRPEEGVLHVCKTTFSAGESQSVCGYAGTGEGRCWNQEFTS